MAELFRYAAFISYSSKDEAFARRLHRALEGYGIPSSLGKFDLIGDGKKNRIYPVFRDREELPAGELGPKIEAALKASNALVVVCSPNSAASTWVQKEIEYFVGLGRRDRVFAIIADKAPLAIDGADATPACFPPAFRGDAAHEQLVDPIAADARKRRDGFRNAWLKVVAGIVGVSPGVLVDRDRRRRRIRRLQALAASAVVLVAAAVGGVRFLSDGLQQRSESLAELARVALTEGRYDRAARYARLGLEMSDSPLIGFPAPEADAVLRRVVASWRVPARLFGHASEVMAGAVSADGDTAITGGDDGDLRLWRLQDGQLIAQLGQPTLGAGVRKVAISANGSLVSVIRDSGALEVWNVGSRRMLFTTGGSDQPVSACAFDREGRRIAFASDGTVTISSADTGAAITRVRSDQLSITDLAFDTRGERLMAASTDRAVRIWNAATGAFVIDVSSPSGEIFSASFSPVDDAILMSTRDGVEVRNIRNAGLDDAYRGHGNSLVRMALFSPEGDRVASYSPYENAMRLWDVGSAGFHELSGERQVVRVPDGYEALDATFHDGGLRTLITRRLTRQERLMRALGDPREEDYTVEVWDVWPDPPPPRLRIPGAHVVSASFDRRGERIATGSAPGEIGIWDARTGSALRRWTAPEGLVSIALSGDGRLLVSAHEEGAIRIWDANGGSPQGVLQGHSGLVESASFSDDGAQIVSVGRDGTVRVWDALSARNTATTRLPDGFEENLLSGTFDPLGARVLIQGGGRAWIWDLSAAAPVELGAADGGSLIRAMWRADGTAVLASMSRGMALFDATDGELLGHISARDPIRSAWRGAFDPFGLLVAVAGDSSVRLFDVSTGTPLRELRDVDARRGLVFDPTGTELLWWDSDAVSIAPLDAPLIESRFDLMASVCREQLAAGWSFFSQEEFRLAPMLGLDSSDACGLGGL